MTNRRLPKYDAVHVPKPIHTTKHLLQEIVGLRYKAQIYMPASWTRDTGLHTVALVCLANDRTEYQSFRGPYARKKAKKHAREYLKYWEEMGTE